MWVRVPPGVLEEIMVTFTYAEFMVLMGMVFLFMLVLYFINPNDHGGGFFD
jgi:hypothetical protein